MSQPTEEQMVGEVIARQGRRITQLRGDVNELRAKVARLEARQETSDEQ